MLVMAVPFDSALVEQFSVPELVMALVDFPRPRTSSTLPRVPHSIQRAVLFRQLETQKTANQPRDFRPIFFEGKVARVEQMELYIF